MSSTSSVRSSILDYPVEHGRQYHAYRDGVYHRPNDEVRFCRATRLSLIRLRSHKHSWSLTVLTS